MKLWKRSKCVFIIALLCLIESSGGLPLAEHNLPSRGVSDDSLTELLDLLAPTEDYNLHYDQRQTGNENYRLRLDGFFVAAPHDFDADDLLQQLGATNLVLTDMYKNSKTSNALQSVSTRPEVVMVGVPSLRMQTEPAEVLARNNYNSKLENLNKY